MISAHAPLDLRAMYGDEYEVTLDPSADVPDGGQADRRWYDVIHGKYGHICIHRSGMLSAFCARPRIAARLASLPGVRVRLRDKGGMSVVFAPEHFQDVARVIQSKRHRYASRDGRARLRTVGFQAQADPTGGHPSGRSEPHDDHAA